MVIIPEGTTKKEASGDHASRRKKDGKVSSWNRWCFDGPACFSQTED